MLNSGLVLVARTDAEAATMIDSNIDAWCAYRCQGCSQEVDEKWLLPTHEAGKKRDNMQLTALLINKTIFNHFFHVYLKKDTPNSKKRVFEHPITIFIMLILNAWFYPYISGSQSSDLGPKDPIDHPHIKGITVRGPKLWSW